jgi:Subtilisin inhibitor-like
MRYRLLFAVSGIAAALAMSGCQDDAGKTGADSGGSSAQKPPAAPPASPPGTAAPQPAKPDSKAHPPDAGPVTADLKVEFKKSDTSAAQVWTLKCGPAGGDHPDAKGACGALAAVESPFAPPDEKACTMIFGGPETAKVTGTWQGQKVDASFSRKDGCEVNRWAKVQKLLPEVPRVR